MFLTRFRVNTARPASRQLLSSPQALHAGVMSSFPQILPSAPDAPRILWRIDRNAAAEVMLYVVGPQRPDLTHLVEQAGWPAAAAAGTPGWQTYHYAPFLDRLENKSVWNFRLTANPVHSIRNRDGVPTKRTAHLTPKHQLGWLLQRQEASGFRVITKPADHRHTEHGDEHQITVSDQRSLDFGKRSTDQKRPNRVTLTTVTYNGRLEVTDPPALRRILTQGLGKAKAYGCGLMTLAPAE
ncbi:type I-E CRISPR-associated protein Cas6/Cse3/CasE [Streptomyces kanamyceticus]|uniref:CRISPR-associated protein n=1 Tax=Streptomyces kanamyceticus TaxID=1967 RepID=Q1EQJ3_STRKN|nr:type I-E CRISPR-associated protein Cas6/Cse3/CasE [Streptomyces kanamyceticus]QEU90558.1 type I-E CRISPR-associated protein Cas6/Cse3/CasE [Streptomyces kanamyceticus]BAE95527.1 CRISPR-associated protein [Streptomyces kanamyceticus]